MRQLQIWLPAFDPVASSAELRRDLQRARQQWRGETTVWLLPDLKKPCAWRTPERPWSFELALPAETSNRIDIFHLGDNGHLHGCGLYSRFLGPCLTGLLEDWLNLLDGTDEHGIAMELAPERLEFQMPRFEGDLVRLEPVRHLVVPAEAIPITHIDPEDGRFECRWPPEGGLLPVVSPSAESLALAGSLERVGHAGGYGSLPEYSHGQEPKHRVLSALGRWPEPFTELFPFGGGTDAILCQVRTRDVAKLSSTDPDEALRRAWGYGGKYLSTGFAAFKDVWFHPRINATSVEDALCALEASFNVRVNTIAEIYDSPSFRAKMTEQVEARVAIGAPGLFWALLIDQLEQQRAFHGCQDCGRLIKGRKDRRFCNSQENANCHRRRRSRDQRKRRTGAKATPGSD